MELAQKILAALKLRTRTPSQAKGGVRHEYDEAEAGLPIHTSAILAALSSHLHVLLFMDKEGELNIGGGLVEIAALTAIIGGPTTESLALGSRGACGLPWAALSSFGSIFVVKACVSACTPSWLRETIGVRTTRSDAATGCSTSLERKTKTGRMSGEAIGVVVEWSKDREVSPSLTIQCDSMEDVYAFDEWTAGPLRSCTTLQPGESLQAHFYLRDPQWPVLSRSQAKIDWLSTGLTLVKLAEVILLYHFGSFHIWWITGANWAYFFVCAVLMQLFQLGRASIPGKQNKCVDVVSGRLPTPQVMGGERKVLMDVPLNPRKSRFWNIVWMQGSVVSICCLIATYALLTKEPTVCFHIWLLFQIVWLGLRSMFFHFARSTDDMKHIVTPAISEKHKPIQYNFRLLGLAAGVSRYQMLNHPRGSYCYTEDAQDPTAIKSLLDAAGYAFTDSLDLPDQHGDAFQVRVVAVIGDTLLSSVSWLMGASFTGMELYDCCIVAIQVSEKTVLVPACRVLSGRVDLEQQLDPESSTLSRFLPKGVSNDGTNISWRYWIPCTKGKWAFFSTPWATSRQKLASTGDKVLAIASADEVTEQLRTGELLVSLADVKEVESAVAQSAGVARILRDMLLTRP